MGFRQKKDCTAMRLGLYIRKHMTLHEMDTFAEYITFRKNTAKNDQNLMYNNVFALGKLPELLSSFAGEEFSVSSTTTFPFK